MDTRPEADTRSRGVTTHDDPTASRVKLIDSRSQRTHDLRHDVWWQGGFGKREMPIAGALHRPSSAAQWSGQAADEAPGSESPSGYEVDQSGQYGEAVEIDDGRTWRHLNRARRTDLNNHPIADQHRGFGLRFQFGAGEHRRTDQGQMASLQLTCRLERRQIEDHIAGNQEQRTTDSDENPAPSHRHSMTPLRFAYVVPAISLRRCGD
jgi:hypothetical protein